MAVRPNAIPLDPVVDGAPAARVAFVMVRERSFKGIVGRRAFPISGSSPAAAPTALRAAIWGAVAHWGALATNHWSPPVHGGVVKDPGNV